MMREAVGRLINIVIQNLIVSTDDRFEMLSEGLKFLIALLMDPPQAYAEDEKITFTQTNLLVDKAESLIRSLYLDKLGEDTAEGRNILLNGLVEMINKAKAELRQLDVQIPGLSSNNVPRTDRRGFFDFLLGNLQKKSAEEYLFPFEKHPITIAHKELASLRHFLMDIFELKDENEELRDIWVQASKAAHLVDYVTDSCLSMLDVPIWSNLIHLSNAVEQIQFVKVQVFKIRKNYQISNNRVTNAKVNSKRILPRQEEANAMTKDDVMVGFEHEEQRIIDRLTRGEVGLDIVAIVGMAGQGKTTLAQRVFQDSSVKLHFHKSVWCCISQEYNIKEILLHILKNLDEPVSPEEDLADRLRKCLKGQRYLIVLDDMWDVKAWHELQFSFPEDNNGSRIFLTSRDRNVALKTNPDCCIVELHPLSSEKSWDLLRMKVFEEDCCPLTLSDIGRTIAENCKGLPLAIVVVAGLLKKDKNVDSWKQISKSLKSQIASEGCMNVLDLSYTHLPDYLKPCFLYLGAFKEDETIYVKRLIKFWIAEGFVQNDGGKSKVVEATKYLMELVDRSLVFVAKRSSKYGIKQCRIHDLLHDFCLIKSKEEGFLLVPNVSDNFSSIRYQYRLCFHQKRSFLISEPLVPSVRSFVVWTSDFYELFWDSFKLLRVLDLGYTRVKQIYFDEILQLIHLRYLAIAGGFFIPSSIANLFRLEVLTLRSWDKPWTLASAVMKMVNLRYMYASECRIEYTEDFGEMELKLSPPLTNLERLTSLEFRSKSFFERVAQKVPNILKLGLSLSFCIHLSSYFKKLESLCLHIFGFQRISKSISPSTLDFPLTLRKLNLRAEQPLSSTMISSIGKLINLEVLKLHVHFEDERWDVEEEEFLQLKYLEFIFSSIQQWNVHHDSFPCLEQLIVKNCFELQELPGRFGEIFTLKRIKIRNCHESISNSFDVIVGEQIESGNDDIQFSIF